MCCSSVTHRNEEFDLNTPQAGFHVPDSKNPAPAQTQTAFKAMLIHLYMTSLRPQTVFTQIILHANNQLLH